VADRTDYLWVITARFTADVDLSGPGAWGFSRRLLFSGWGGGVWPTASDGI